MLTCAGVKRSSNSDSDSNSHSESDSDSESHSDDCSEHESSDDLSVGSSASGSASSVCEDVVDARGGQIGGGDEEGEAELRDALHGGGNRKVELTPGGRPALNLSTSVHERVNLLAAAAAAAAAQGGSSEAAFSATSAVAPVSTQPRAPAFDGSPAKSQIVPSSQSQISQSGKPNLARSKAPGPGSKARSRRPAQLQYESGTCLSMQALLMQVVHTTA
jgi:hypothetical protein